MAGPLADIIADPVFRSVDGVCKRLVRLASPDPTRSSKGFTKLHFAASLLDADQNRRGLRSLAAHAPVQRDRR